jgi:hypothetical protein
MGFSGQLLVIDREPLMSALGQKQTWQHILLMSALPPKADMGTQPRDVRFVPIADIVTCTVAHNDVTDIARPE